MTGGGGGGKRIERIRTIALALPEAVEKPFGGHTSAPAFRVRDKFFVMCSEDGGTINLKAAEGVQAILIRSDPDRFFVPKYVGPKGWVGVRLGSPTKAEWDEVAEMIIESYCLIAPARLVAQYEATTST